MGTGSDYRVQIEVYEGPLDLLLYLIRREEVDIREVSIEKITSRYLEYLDWMRALNLEIAGEFVVMAATLLYIKSRSLLPAEERTEIELDDDEEGEDPREELIRKLIEYRRFKDAALHLEEKWLQAEGRFPRPAVEEPEIRPDPAALLGDVGLFDLIAALQKVIDRASSRMERHEIFREEYTVADKIEEILRRTATRARIRFSELFEEASSRQEVVVIFLALLELIRLRQVRARQFQPFGEIEIERVVG